LGVLLIAIGLLGIFGITIVLFVFFQSGFNIAMDPVTMQYFGGIVSGGNGAFLFALALYAIAFVPLWLMGMLGNYLFKWKRVKERMTKKSLSIALFILAIIWMVALSYAISQGVSSAHKVGSYIQEVGQTLESNPHASFYMHIKDEDDGGVVLDINWQDEMLIIGDDEDMLQIPFGVINEDDEAERFPKELIMIPFGTDSHLIGGDAAPGSSLDDVSITAAGTEPFWSFTYSEGKILWRAPAMDAVGNMVEEAYDVGFARTDNTYTLWGLGSNDGVRTKVTKEVCSDGMSDREYTHKVKMMLNEREYHGCANVE